MGASERRLELLEVLCSRRYDTIANLAMEFDVSERTIRRDVASLSLNEPIYTQTGRYGGGVYVMDNYYFGRVYLNDDEIKLLEKIAEVLETKKIDISNSDLLMLKRIISKRKKPKVKK